MDTSKKISYRPDSGKKKKESLSYEKASQDDLPELTDLQIMELRPRYPEHFKAVKKSVQIRLDSDVLAFFKSFGPGYQTRINSVLREYMLRAKK